VVRLLDIGIDCGRVYIVLDLVEGLHPTRADLRQVMANGPLPLERAVNLMQQACEGMVAVHKEGIVHRDLKPENILITRDDTVKLTGFSNARLPDYGARTTTTQRESTALFTAPESIWGKTTSDKMDVYSMGQIAYQAISGKHPLVKKPLPLLTICELQRS